jgi:type I restriction enzyme S subunit
MKYAKVGDVAEQIRGVSYSKGDESSIPLDGFLPILRANNITEDGLALSELVFVPRTKIRERQLIRENDVLIAASSGSLDVVGKAAQAIVDLSAAFGAFCKVLRPGPNIWPKYFGHFFRTQSYRRAISSKAGGVNINNLRSEHLDELEIPLPAISEQKRIAAILDSADNLRTKRRESIALLDIFLQSVFLDMFGNPETNEKKWNVRKLGDVAAIQGGFAFASRDYAPEGVRLIKISNVHQEDIIWDEVSYLPQRFLQKYQEFSLRDGDIVMSLTRPIIRSLNAVKVARIRGEDLPALLNQRVARLVPDDKILNRTYLLQFCYTAYFKRKVASYSSESLQPNVSTRQIEEIPLPLPPIDIQQVFCIRASAIRRLKKALFISSNTLDALFASLQQRAFNGMISSKG